MRRHDVGDMQSAGSTVKGCLSPGTVVELAWLLVCVRCEARQLCATVVPREFDNSPRQEKLLLVF